MIKELPLFSNTCICWESANYRSFTLKIKGHFFRGSNSCHFHFHSEMRSNSYGKKFAV